MVDWAEEFSGRGGRGAFAALSLAAGLTLGGLGCWKKSPEAATPSAESRSVAPASPTPSLRRPPAQPSASNPQAGGQAVANAGQPAPRSAPGPRPAPTPFPAPTLAPGPGPAPTPAPPPPGAPRAIPVVLVLAETAEKPNITRFVIVNQTKETVALRPQYFALILRGQREPRIYDPHIDNALVPLTVPPSTRQADGRGNDGEAAGRIEWGGSLPPLGSQKLVFNPAPLGHPPSFLVIQNNPSLGAP
jgi:hypothetical protein